MRKGLRWKSRLRRRKVCQGALEGVARHAGETKRAIEDGFAEYDKARSRTGYHSEEEPCRV